MTEGGRANCCLYWEKAFNKGDGTIPSHHIGNKGEREEETDNWAEGLQGNRFFCYAQLVHIQRCLAGPEA